MRGILQEICAGREALGASYLPLVDAQILMIRVHPLNDIAGSARHLRFFEVSIPHRRPDIGMTEDGLDLVNAHPILDQPGGVRMAKRVNRAVV